MGHNPLLISVIIVVSEIGAGIALISVQEVLELLSTLEAGYELTMWRNIIVSS